MTKNGVIELEHLLYDLVSSLGEILTSTSA